MKTLQASTSVAAAGSQTATTWNLTTALGGLLTAKVTNGSTGPTIGCTVTVNVSGDGSAWKLLRSFLADNANSAVSEFTLEIPPGAMYLQLIFSGHTAQAVTVEAFGEELTSIG